jgi:hypothetical protein
VTSRVEEQNQSENTNTETRNIFQNKNKSKLRLCSRKQRGAAVLADDPPTDLKIQIALPILR